MQFAGMGQAIRVMAGKTFIDGWQLVRNRATGLSALEPGDTLTLTFRRAQGDAVIAAATLTIGDGIGEVNTANGEFTVTLTPTRIGALRTALGLGPQDLGRCSAGLSRTRDGVTEAAGRLTVILEPEA